MRLNIKEILKFFDGIEDNKKGDANAIIAVLGEDLNAAAYKLFKENTIEILEMPVTQGSMKGKRLDRWLLDKENKILYQCEIKNWAGTAIGGKLLKADANEEETRKVSMHHWQNQIKALESDLSHPDGVSKVLIPMRPPLGYEKYHIEPLLIYWMPISKDGGLRPNSSISNFKSKFGTPFKKVNVFSVSLYLRHLMKNGNKYINLDMPHYEHRLKILNNIQK